MMVQTVILSIPEKYHTSYRLNSYKFWLQGYIKTTSTKLADCTFDNKKQNIQSNLYKEVTFGTNKMWSFKTGDLLKEVLNSYEIFYDRTKKRWPFNTGDRLGRSDCISNTF